MSDAQWLADLLAHGLLRASIVPPPAIQQLRDLTRTRKQLVREKTRHVQRIHEVLDRVNIKLGTVLTDARLGRRRLHAAQSERSGRPPAPCVEHKRPRLPDPEANDLTHLQA